MSWISCYIKLRKRLRKVPVDVGNLAYTEGWKVGDVLIGFASWDAIPKDRWPEVEALIAEFATKLRALVEESNGSQ